MASPPPITIEVEFIEAVGSGSFATVHRARRTDTSEIVAVKSVRLHLEDTERDEQIERLKKDFNIVAQLNHANLIRHIHHQRPPNTNAAEAPTYHIIMEYCEGPTLRRMVQTVALTPLILRKWTKEILDGIGYLHQLRLIHRDIKGENILMTTNDINNCRIKIADLGNVKQLLNEATKTREVTHEKGSWAFMSPEMITGAITDVAPEEKIWVGRKTDVWSLGCVVIEMINGGLPHFYKSGNDNQRIRINGGLGVMYFVGSGGSPTVPNGLPAQVQDFVNACLTRDPKERPAVADLQAHVFVTSAEEEIEAWMLPPRDP